jgi:2'-5' RNA ligase
LFLGDISYPVAECISQGIQDVMVQPFHLSLDRLGFFEKKEIFWVGPSIVPVELESLFKSVRNCVQHCGISKLSKRYIPHLSLLRKCNVPISNPDFAPIKMEVDEFHMIESRLDRDRARYYVVESFPLASLV